MGKDLNCAALRHSSPSMVPRWLPPAVTMARVAMSGFRMATSLSSVIRPRYLATISPARSSPVA